MSTEELDPWVVYMAQEIGQAYGVSAKQFIELVIRKEYGGFCINCKAEVNAAAVRSLQDFLKGLQK